LLGGFFCFFGVGTGFFEVDEVGAGEAVREAEPLRDAEEGATGGAGEAVRELLREDLELEGGEVE